MKAREISCRINDHAVGGKAVRRKELVRGTEQTKVIIYGGAMRVKYKGYYGIMYNEMHRDPPYLADAGAYTEREDAETTRTMVLRQDDRQRII